MLINIFKTLINYLFLKSFNITFMKNKKKLSKIINENTYFLSQASTVYKQLDIFMFLIILSLPQRHQVLFIRDFLKIIYRLITNSTMLEIENKYLVKTPIVKHRNDKAVLLYEGVGQGFQSSNQFIVTYL